MLFSPGEYTHLIRNGSYVNYQCSVLHPFLKLLWLFLFFKVFLTFHIFQDYELNFSIDFQDRGRQIIDPNIYIAMNRAVHPAWFL